MSLNVHNKNFYGGGKCTLNNRARKSTYSVISFSSYTYTYTRTGRVLRRRKNDLK